MKETAINAAKEAGRFLKERMGKIETINIKGKDDFVTDVDQQAEKIIKNIITSAYPAHNILAEESGHKNNHSDYTWIIDPLSSTTNYIHSLHLFSVAVAVLKDNKPIIGVVYDPLREEIFSAEKGKGAFLNNQKIIVSKVTTLNNSLICLTLKKKTNGEEEKSTTYFKKLFPLSTIKMMGSTAVHLCHIACGRIEGFIETKSDIFATPAGKIILEEAGGSITDSMGSEWTLDSKDCIATNGIIHNELLQVIK